VFGEDSEEWLGTSPHLQYSVGIGSSDYRLLRFVKGNIRGHIMQPTVHLYLQTAEMEFCHHSVIFRLIIQWQKCICQDRILMRSEAVHRLD
jgi:hypothetical protein